MGTVTEQEKGVLTEVAGVRRSVLSELDLENGAVVLELGSVTDIHYTEETLDHWSHNDD